MDIYVLYVLLCDESEYYIGITNDIKHRFQEHNTKESLFTKRYTVVKLIYTERYPDRKAAAKRERQLKGWSHAKKAALVRRDMDTVKQLSKRLV